MLSVVCIERIMECSARAFRVCVRVRVREFSAYAHICACTMYINVSPTCIIVVVLE